MKVSGYTFLRNAEMLGFPFVESIKSILPLVDEFIIALGPSEDNTETFLKNINNDKIKILHTSWNENMHDRGFVYAQQKMIAQFNCTGDWAFYLEGDEVIHEDDLPKIKQAMELHLNNPKVEALVFDYIHFYGNANTYIDSPHWYRCEARIIKNNIRSFAVDGLYWYIMEKNRVARYPHAAHTCATMYHYGWIRSENQMNLKLKKVEKYWNKENSKINYRNFDSRVLKKFIGSHPKIMKNWLPATDDIFKTDPDYRPTWKDNKYYLLTKIEKFLNCRFSKKHFILVK